LRPGAKSPAFAGDFVDQRLERAGNELAEGDQVHLVVAAGGLAVGRNQERGIEGEALGIVGDDVQ